MFFVLQYEFATIQVPIELRETSLASIFKSRHVTMHGAALRGCGLSNAIILSLELHGVFMLAAARADFQFHRAPFV